MRASMILALSAFSLALGSTAWAEEAAKPAPADKTVVLLPETKIKLRAPRPQAIVDVNRMVPRAPLPELRKPLVDRIAAAVEKDPF